MVVCPDLPGVALRVKYLSAINGDCWEGHLADGQGGEGGQDWVEAVLLQNMGSCVIVGRDSFGVLKKRFGSCWCN